MQTLGQLPVRPPKPPNPIVPRPTPALRVHARDVRNRSAIRCLCARIADATSRGLLDPRRANSMLFAIGIAGRQLDASQAEELSRQLADLQSRPLPSVTTYDVTALEVLP
jgi:hypothetical protein